MALKLLYNALSDVFGAVAPCQPHETIAVHLVRLKRIWQRRQLVAGLASAGVLLCASGFLVKPTSLSAASVGGAALMAIHTTRRARAVARLYKGLRRKAVQGVEANLRYTRRTGERLSTYLPQMEAALVPLGQSFASLSVGAVHRLPDSAFQLFPDQVYGYERYAAQAEAALDLAPKKKAPHWGPS